MKTYKYNLTLSASSEKEADSKMEALSVLGQRLSPKELSKLAHVIKNDPEKTALAKQYLGV